MFLRVEKIVILKQKYIFQLQHVKQLYAYFILLNIYYLISLEFGQSFYRY